LGLVNKVLFPGPVAVSRAFLVWARDGTLLLDIQASLKRVAMGWVAGGVSGIVLGLLSGRLAWANVSVGRIVNTLRAVPPVALVPLAILWFGISESSKVFLVSWGTFFPVWLNTHLGASNVKKSIEWSARSLGMDRYRLVFKVILPSSVPSIVAGLRLAIGIAYICVFVGELAGASQGLGFRIATASLVFRADLMLAGLVVLGILGAASDAAFLSLARRVLPWLRDLEGH
jgi:NitT/TauT family transport system permease protein/sulfonate transport system permease protein